MTNFIETVKNNDNKITSSFMKEEIKRIHLIEDDLKSEKDMLNKQLKQINYLLDLIEKHEVESKSGAKNETHRKTWLVKLEKKLEDYNLVDKDVLSNTDKKFLEEEKSKLLFEKEKIKEELKTIIKEMAETKVSLMEVNETVVTKMTKGHNLASVSEKLREKFGKEFAADTYYEVGADQIIEFLEKEFKLNKVESHVVFSILEDTLLIYFLVDNSYIAFNSLTYDAFYTNMEMSIGEWHVNA